MTSAFPPRCAARYRPERPLASGGFGSVWLATQENLDRPVAIKLLRSDVLAEPHQLERFLAEARITASLAHPNIVTILDHDVEDGVPWIAYELLTGPSLRDRLAGGTLPPAEALEAAAQVASALALTHQQGVLHRDIKPENVLESEPGFYKVTDFGIARWNRAGAVKTKTGVVLGTPAYMAPEHIRGEPSVPAGDQYSLGAMLYELLTGRPPFLGENALAVMNMHVRDTAPAASTLRPGLPPSLDALLAKALDKQPEARFPDCLAFKAALEAEIPRLPAGGVRRGRILRAPTLIDTAPPPPAAGPRSTAPQADPPAAPWRRWWAPAALGAALAVAAALAPSKGPAPPAAPPPASIASPASASPVPRALPALLAIPGICTSADPAAVDREMRHVLDALRELPDDDLRVPGTLDVVKCVAMKFAMAHQDGAASPEMDRFDAELDRREPALADTFQYWLAAAQWRSVSVRGSHARRLRSVHDGTVAVSIGTAEQGPLVQLFTALAQSRRHWRQDNVDADPDWKLEWDLQRTLYQLGTYAWLSWKYPVDRGYVRSLVAASRAAIQGMDRRVLELLARDRWPDDPAAWLAAIEAAKARGLRPNQLRAVLTRAIVAHLEDNLTAGSGLVPPAGPEDPMIRIYRERALMDHAMSTRAELLAVLAKAPCKGGGAYAHRDGAAAECLGRMEASYPANLLATWLGVALARRPGNAELRRARRDALLWTAVLRGGTCHWVLGRAAAWEAEDELQHPSLPAGEKAALAAITARILASLSAAR